MILPPVWTMFSCLSPKLGDEMDPSLCSGVCQYRAVDAGTVDIASTRWAKNFSRSGIHGSAEF